MTVLDLREALKPFCRPGTADLAVAAALAVLEPALAEERARCAALLNKMAENVAIASPDDSDRRAYALAGREIALNEAAAAIRALPPIVR